MRRELVLTPKFKRAFRKFVGRNARLQKRIEDTLMQMQEDVFAASLGTHKLSGTLEGLRALRPAFLVYRLTSPVFAR
jgi:mRNA-degrading endonuclease YafQ of YafQ-DinJ toxin-antitoxin module